MLVYYLVKCSRDAGSVFRGKIGERHGLGYQEAARMILAGMYVYELLLVVIF